MKTRALSPVQRFGLALLLSSSAAIAPGIPALAQSQDEAQVQNQSDPQAQSPATPQSNPAPPSRKHAKHPPPEPPPPQPAPSIVIPVTPLGFAPPAPFYLGDRVAQVSLNFIDEDNLLFTFRVPGLIAREHNESKSSEPEVVGHAERHIRALVLSLPTGKVTAEAMWRLHDYGPFLWMLKDHRFLLRDRNTVQTGDAALQLKPFLRFPGQVKYIELGPDQRFLIADTSEPVSSSSKDALGEARNQDFSAESNPQSSPETPAFPTAASPPGQFRLDSQDDKSPSHDTENLLRILHMDTGKVMLVSRVPGVVNLSLDGNGYYEALRGSGFNWMISYTDFSGNSTPLLPVESTCYPALDVMAPGMVLASACQGYNGRKLTAFVRDPDSSNRPRRLSAQSPAQNPGEDSNKRRLWEATLPPTKVWPLIARASDGLRIARATLDVSHPISPSAPLDMQDIRGQSVQVYDLANGKIQLTVTASPVLDGGGGFALSPSGRRFAVLNAGAIQIYDLPPAPAILSPGAAQPNQAQSNPVHP